MLKWVKSRGEILEQFLVDVIYERCPQTLFIRIFAAFLKALSFVFRGVVQLRYLLYKEGFFRSKPLGCLVVTVGNLTVGGTGKTPVVEKFARSLQERGRKVAILSRGYKSKPESLPKRFWRWLTSSDPIPPKVVSDGHQVLLDSETAGDESYMLARNLPGVIVLVDKNRVNAGSYAIQKFGVDTLILDDGFQYLPLKGRLNLLLVDKTNPFGNGYLLPRGILREPIRHLKRASYIFLTKSDGKKDPELEATIKKYNPAADVIECNHMPRYFQLVGVDICLELNALKDKKIAAFSGIAVPESFENFLTNLGIQIIYKERFTDHHRFSYEELEKIFIEARKAGATAVITTEKDAVRIPHYFKPDIPLYYLRMEIGIINGSEDFNQAVSRICFPKRKMKSTRSPLIKAST